MGLDELKLGPGTLYMKTTDGNTVSQVQVGDVFCETPLSAEAEVDYEFEFRAPLIQELTSDFCVIDQSLLKHIMSSPHGWYMDYEADELVQVRRHRKKRINKKWAKRYGYKTVRRKFKFNCDQITFEQNGDLNTIYFETKRT